MSFVGVSDVMLVIIWVMLTDVNSRVASTLCRVVVWDGISYFWHAVMGS